MRENETITYYDSGYHGEFPVGPYFRDKFNTIAKEYSFDYKFELKEVIKYLSESEEVELIHATDVIFRNDEPLIRRTYVSKQNQKFVISIFSEAKKTECEIFIYYTDKERVEKHITVFNKLVVDEANKKVGLILRDEFGLVLKKFDVSPDGEFDVNNNYNDGFKETSDKIISRLNDDNSTGLVLLHGKPGTGKTTYIRHLTTLLDKDIMYVPNNMADILTSPEFIPFMMKYPNSVLIVEDAESVIRDRNTTGNSTAVSNILNMSDGIMGECLKTQIIATFNTDRESIDKALLRKGRLIAEYEFDELCVDKSNKLLKSLKINHTTKQPMSLADIYNYEDTIGINDNTNKKIGF